MGKRMEDGRTKMKVEECDGMIRSEGRGGRRSHFEVGCKSLSAVVVEAVLCGVPTVLAQSCFQGEPVLEGPPRCILLQTPPSFPGLNAAVPLISAARNMQRPLRCTIRYCHLAKAHHNSPQSQTDRRSPRSWQAKGLSPPQPTAEPNGSTEFCLKAKVALCQRGGRGTNRCLEPRWLRREAKP